MNYNMTENATVVTDNYKVEIDEKIENKTEKLKNNKVIYKFIKRVVDIIGGLFGVIVLVPITAILYIVRLFSKEDKGPLFYVQLRIGKNGNDFKFYKYRSMVMYADEKLFKYLKEDEEAAKEYKKYKKLQNDPRITKLGNFLRKTSLDEFPQFINVLKGDMSLVGPRPYLHREIEDMGENYEKIIKVKPGLTGYWQVNGRSEVDFKERMQMDLAYIQDRSLWFDFKILIKTVLNILKKEEKGAI